MNRPRSSGLIALALLLSSTGAAAFGKDGKPASWVVLRGAQTADDAPPAGPAAAVPAPAAALRGRAELAAPQLISPMPDAAPRFTWNPAPRVGGFASAPDGGQCRQSCAQSYYMCGSGDDQQNCSQAWTQCLATCLGRNDGGS